MNKILINPNQIVRVFILKPRLYPKYNYWIPDKGAKFLWWYLFADEWEEGYYEQHPLFGGRIPESKLPALCERKHMYLDEKTKLF
jgi:hypothetical protein